MLRIPLTSIQRAVAQWAIEHLAYDFADDRAMGFPDWSSFLPVIEDDVLILGTDILPGGEGSPVDGFCYVLQFRFETKGYLDFGVDADRIYEMASQELRKAIYNTESALRHIATSSN